MLLFSGGRIRSSCCTLRRRHSDRTRCRSRSCMSTPATTSAGHRFPRQASGSRRPRSADGVRLIVASVQESIDTGRVEETTDPSGVAQPGCRRAPCSTHSNATNSTRRSAVPARRGPAQARSGCSASATSSGEWDPRAQRAEPWSLYNGRIRRGSRCASSRCRTGPSWTSGATSNSRTSSCRPSTSPRSATFHPRRDPADGVAVHPSATRQASDHRMGARYRTVGDLTITGAVRSTATTLPR